MAYKKEISLSISNFSMKFGKFFIATFLLVLALDRTGGFILDRLHSQVRVGENAGILNTYLYEVERPEITFHGSSRVKHHVVPEIFGTSTYIFGYSGMELPFHAVQIEILEERKLLPSKKIVVNIDPYTEKAEDLEIPKSVRHLRRYYNESEAVKININVIDKYEAIKYLSSLYRYNGKVLGLVNNLIKTKKGESAQIYVPLSRSEQSGETLLELKQKIFPSEEVQELMIPYLERIIAVGLRNDVEVVFVTAPIYYEYVGEGSSPNIIKEYLQGRKVKYINFVDPQNEIKELRNTDIWRDQTHLTHEGAKIYSKKFKERL